MERFSLSEKKLGVIQLNFIAQLSAPVDSWMEIWP